MKSPLLRNHSQTGNNLHFSILPSCLVSFPFHSGRLANTKKERGSRVRGGKDTKTRPWTITETYESSLNRKLNLALDIFSLRIVSPIKPLRQKFIGSLPVIRIPFRITHVQCNSSSRGNEILSLKHLVAGSSLCKDYY